MKALLITILALTLLSCSGGGKRYVIGVTQCSEDIWRDKQNEELRMASYFFEGIDLRIAAADDVEERQVQQIEQMVNDDVDLLIISPIKMSASITEAVEKAYDRGIPVILFERRIESEKYNTFVHADNAEIGRVIGNYVGTLLQGKGKVAEICGMQGSSSAASRHSGFMEAMENFPDIEIVSSRYATWKEESGLSAMDSLISIHGNSFDCVFGHNDRMATGARRSLVNHYGADASFPKFVGVDGLLGEGQGIENVRDGIFEASMIYPTAGDLILQIAMDILQGKPYDREYFLQSALVTKDNAEVLIMQGRELSRQQHHLGSLRDKVIQALADYNHQQIYLILLIIIIALIILTYSLLHRANTIRRKMSEAAANEKIQFFTNVSHEFRTPLTLVAAPLERVLESKTLSQHERRLLEMIQKNISILLKLVDDILQFRQRGEKADIDEVFRHEKYVDDTVEVGAMKTITRADGQRREKILVVDDNEGIRTYLADALGDYYDVVVASDGKEGLSAALKNSPDLVITDVMMPVMDGMELCRRLKEDDATCHIPVLMLTAKAMDSQRQEGYESGADAYLTKPFSSNLVLMRVRNLIDNRRRLREAFIAATPSDTKTAGKTSDSPASEDMNLAERFRDIVLENISAPELSVEMISEKMGMSRTQLYRKVKALTGSTPVEIIRITRLKKAERMLATTDKTISEVAYDVGFSSQSYFTKCFKEYFGRTPGDK